MIVDPNAAAFFRLAFEADPENGRCVDCGTQGADWASISHGIYLSIGASGVHRSLGVRVSFVQSTTMDSWKPLHLRMMELGGNRRFTAFLEEQGVPQDMPLRQKYRTRAAAWYRENLRALAEETTPPEPLPPGTGQLPSEDAAQDGMASMLDQVFSAAPRCDEMTRGGVPIARPRSVAAGHQRRHREGSRRSRKVSSIPGWVSKQLDRMTTSKGTRVAEKLKTMSTGSMQGLGPDDVMCAALPSSREEVEPHLESSNPSIGT
eukprot:CAMPEP_0183419832 /NCGR_PEP_ID=MMETSP0370-20130417/26044_1 /TAXON_ID=268820 /ORGANISM="Peridinium aciculiferum, Strain PAER-2" /LENGTH=261 /DNA_ID=CAMNT_0025603667 /DNA_START=1 /DNA_END=786 /DNA_ORIENTATION=+